MPRARAVENPVTLVFDGQKVTAEEGEPIACALVAAGHVQIARSPKYHRPRGPACFRAACDGCLARVDGEPNVMTCMTPSREGTVVEAQNTLGSREIDLLRVTDWFFAHGFNHHELFAGVPGVEKVMQIFARRVAGLGTLPREPLAPRRAARRELDALVIGAGPAGTLAALALRERGREVEILDDAPTPGGATRALPGFAELPLVDVTRAVAAGIYGDDVLVVSEEGASVVRAKTVVLAPGAHDGALAFEGNDLPGIMSARAGFELARRGVRAGARAVCLLAGGDGVYARALAELGEVEIIEGTPIAARGSSRVKGAVIEVAPQRAGSGKQRSIDCDALFVDAPRAPAYELCEQAGAALHHRPSGYFVASGEIRPGFYAVGEVAGTALDPDAMRRAVRALF